MSEHAKTESNVIRVVLVEDNAYLRTAWETALEDVQDVEVHSAFGSVEAVRTEALEEADVVLMDIGLPGASGIEGVRLFTQQHPHLSIVMVTVHDDDEHVFDALCAGAVGYLLKQVDSEEMVRAIRSAVSGGAPMTPEVARRVIEAFRERPPPKAEEHALEELTDREREVLEHLARGESYSATAKGLFLSVDGVRYHIRHIYEKLHVHTRSEAVAKGLRHSLIKPPW